MDIRQLRYLAEIADSGSISKAAQKLYISQSGLNQQLMRIEQEMGTTLFERSTHSLKITEAGEIVLAYARDAIMREEHMKREVDDVLDGTSGSIRLNLAMDFGAEIFCAVFPLFHQLYPRMAIKLQDHIVYEQYDRLMKGKLDIGMVMIHKRENPQLVFVHLADERFLLGVPRTHPLAEFYQPAPDGDYPLMDLEKCREEPFSLMFAGSTMRQVIDPLFEAAGYEPQILFECRTNHVAGYMVSHGICLTILPESQAKKWPDILWFRLPGEPVWEGCMVYHRENPPRRAGWCFIELAKEKAEEIMTPSRPVWQ